MTINNEQIYINRIRDGDSSAFSFIVDKYKNMAYTIALKMIRDPAAAEDATQESFIKAYEAIDTYKGNAKFSTWLYTIVYRTCLSILKQKKTLPLDDEEYNNRMDDQPPALEASEQSKYISRAISELPATEAIVITLYYMNGNSVREISKITGLSMPNVKIQLYRARKKLEHKLAGLL
ncbi:RNA polymerase sigma factor [Chitinophaga silvisoli]|uniref:Sigma-70 family RNA polymerase sigma factor n=1 Tax=Chitinophaga silvisoli TaxID=2291814 RepID=A0A3E1NXI1_9BACT|nr:sigma-70 family RNA polymerase sigma factor [Chitinophaga silvisoli]RFM32468.1 sigma-70 family RNA polymerase sigma factor [Chitinophaga silvisoli]